MGSEAASVRLTVRGARAIRSGRIARYSAALPMVRPSTPHTRSPTAGPRTPGVTSATSPVKSMPVRCGKRRPVTSRTRPARPASSPPLTLVACTLTSTSPGFGTGTGRRPS